MALEHLRASLKDTVVVRFGDYDYFVHRGDRVVFVDDVISTGGTLLAIAEALGGIGAEIVDILIVFEKTRTKAAMEKQVGAKIKTLLKVDVVKGKVVERA